MGHTGSLTANGWKKNTDSITVGTSAAVGNFACNQEGKCLGLYDMNSLRLSMKPLRM